jgi:small neutral amino acid transporter SnatA (MarC family)
MARYGLGCRPIELFNFATALIVIVNPIGAAPLFIALTEVRPAERRRIAATACVTSASPW